MSKLEASRRVFAASAAATLLGAAAACSSSKPPAEAPKKAEPPKPQAKVTKQPWGKGLLGTAVDLYTLRNLGGTEVVVSNWGATVVSIKAKDRVGKAGEITIGFDTIEGYQGTHPYFGATVGRYANRIAKGAFDLDGVTYNLAKNNGENHLHGGNKGFDKAVWRATPSADGVEMRLMSRDGDEGYPGDLDVRVTYTLTEDDLLRIEYFATTSRDTHLNLSNHTYFNLAGGGDVLKHELRLAADKFLPVDAGLIPTGELKPVRGTPFDFTSPTAIGARIDAKDPQLAIGGGYDHNFVLTSGGGSLAMAAELYDPASGRVLTVSTDQPGVQLYSGNFLDGKLKGRGGVPIEKRAAVCLETQHFPDSPNKPKFPTTLLKAGTEFHSTTTWQFSAR